MKTLVLFFAVCVAVAYSQKPEPCSPPSLWEARISRIDPEKRFSERAKISYDATNRRIRIIEEVNLLLEREYYDVLFIHNTEPGTEYRFNLKTKECNKREISDPWRPFQVPPNSTFLGESYIGTGAVPGAGVQTQLWERGFEGGDKYFGVYTVVGCIPIQEEFYSRRTGLVTSTFFDVTGGIADPNVFIPPRECE